MPRRPCYGALAPSRSESGSAPAGCRVDFRIKPDSCVACMACVRVCPADAVAVEGAIVRIVDEACTRCGLCLPACPHDAIEALGDGDWGTMIRSTCPVIVETVRRQYPELIPYLAQVATPIAAEARYLKQLYGAGTPVVYAGVCRTEGGPDVDAAITFAELADMFRRSGIVVADQA